MIGNLLSTRKFEVVFVDKKGEKWIRVPEAKDGDEQVEIESLIVPEVVRRHEASVNGGRGHGDETAKEKPADGGQEVL